MAFHTRPLTASTVLDTRASPRLLPLEKVASAAVVKMLSHEPCSGHAAPSTVPKSRVGSGVGLRGASVSIAAITASAALPSRSEVA
eukprot:4480741-Prymnesium_polylepis.1